MWNHVKKAVEKAVKDSQTELGTTLQPGTIAMVMKNEEEEQEKIVW